MLYVFCCGFLKIRTFQIPEKSISISVKGDIAVPLTVPERLRELFSFLYVPIQAFQTLKTVGILLIYVNWFFFNRAHNKTTTAQKQKPGFIGISSRTEKLQKAEVRSSQTVGSPPVAGEQLPGIMDPHFLSVRKPVKSTESFMHHSKRSNLR